MINQVIIRAGGVEPDLTQDGKKQDCPERSGKGRQSTDYIAEADGNELVLRSIMDGIGIDTLTSKIDLPIDSARASFTLDAVIVGSAQEFNRAVASFLIHLFDSVGSLSGPIDQTFAEAEALDLIERAFSKIGGVSGALSESRHGYKGGMRNVLDMMAEQFRLECHEKEVNRVLKASLDPLDWSARVKMISRLMRRLGHHLPEEILGESPEKFAGHWEMLVRSYVQALDLSRATFCSL